MARNKFPGSASSLDALCKRFRIDNSRRVHHTALIDCDLLFKVYVNLIDQKEPKLNFENSNISEKVLDNSKISYYKKVITPTSEELSNHEKYLKEKLKKNYY